MSFGSGAEFGLDRDINNFSERQLLNYFPVESYGFSKNVIARTILNTENFHNLRLFSCFHSTESERRLLKKFNRHTATEPHWLLTRTGMLNSWDYTMLH